MGLIRVNLGNAAAGFQGAETSETPRNPTSYGVLNVERAKRFEPSTPTLAR